MSERRRPCCSRCGGPLDVFWEPETESSEWVCNNPTPMSDADFWEWFDFEPAVARERLLSEVGPKGKL